MERRPLFDPVAYARHLASALDADMRLTYFPNRAPMVRRPLVQPIPLHEGDCIDVLRTFADNSVDSVVTDPPYNLDTIKKRFGSATAAPAQYGRDGAFGRVSRGFMGKQWDNDIAFHPAVWTEVLRVLKPGGHLLSFGGTRTYHRMACAIEDAGFEIRDQIGWLYGSGMPKSHNVSKAIDKAAGAVREIVGRRTDGRYANPMPVSGRSAGIMGEVVARVAPDITSPATPDAEYFDGWGTGLKPAWEPIVVARKPFNGSVVRNVLAYGTGVMNIDACRVGTETKTNASAPSADRNGFIKGFVVGTESVTHDYGRWPANVIHDGSDEVLDSFAVFGDRKACMSPSLARPNGTILGGRRGQGNLPMDAGTAARYFYCAKASKAERNGSKHPTVKPLALMRYLCRLITPVGGTVLDPFAGTGTTGQAASMEGFQYILIESDPQYCIDARNRIGSTDKWQTQGLPVRYQRAKTIARSIPGLGSNGHTLY